MPLITDKYYSIFTTADTSAHSTSISPTHSFRWDVAANTWNRMYTDPVMDVSDATRIYVEGNVTNSCGNVTVSTDIDIHILASWGSTTNSTGASFSSSGFPYATHSMSGSSNISGFLVNPGPELIKVRCSAASSGGLGSSSTGPAESGFYVYTTITKNVR
jgi:hypothetical protein